MSKADTRKAGEPALGQTKLRKHPTIDVPRTATSKASAPLVLRFVESLRGTSGTLVGGITCPQCLREEKVLDSEERASSRRLITPVLVLPLLLSVSLAVGISSVGNAQVAGSYYTDAQAANGRIVFGQQCAICHGQNLRGKVGPALAGPQFLSVSQYQELTADYLYKFMVKQMPKNAPGSLGKTQYLDLLAYILKVNGYPAGEQKLTADDGLLTQIKIEPTGKPPAGDDKTEDPQ
jgi:mono/diheme cytochrome c family protein